MGHLDERALSDILFLPCEQPEWFSNLQVLLGKSRAKPANVPAEAELRCVFHPDGETHLVANHPYAQETSLWRADWKSLRNSGSWMLDPWHSGAEEVRNCNVANLSRMGIGLIGYSSSWPPAGWHQQRTQSHTSIISQNCAPPMFSEMPESALSDWPLH